MATTTAAAAERPTRLPAPEVEPCRKCGDPGGRLDKRKAGHPPIRRDGTRLGLPAGICQRCYEQAYDREARPGRPGRLSGRDPSLMRRIRRKNRPEDDTPERDLKSRVTLRLLPEDWERYVLVRRDHIAGLDDSGPRWRPSRVEVWLV